MSSKIEVLDQGYVQLVDNMGDDLSVVRSARVSYNAGWRAGTDKGSDTNLIGYLARNQHSTPFESCVLTFEVEAPIFVIRQWHRHRTWTYNEMSARYTELPEKSYTPFIEQITTQSQDNKQMRTEHVSENAEEIQDLIVGSCHASFDVYRRLLELGAPRELARGVLPLNTYSKMFATANLWNLVKFIKLRDHAHAQHEIAVYARAMKQLAMEKYPISMAAFFTDDE